MNQREPTHSPCRWRKALHCLSFMLLQAMAPEGQALPPPAPVTSRTRPVAEPRPYLPVAGAPALRFQEPTPPPDLAARPPAAAPPTPPLTPTESSVAESNAAAAASASPFPTAQTAQPASPEKPASKTPAPILRDDVRPAVRPEDFLPFFQIPGSAQKPEDVTLLVPAPKSAPAPATLPPSSATYTQTPR